MLLESYLFMKRCLEVIIFVFETGEKTEYLTRHTHGFILIKKDSLVFCINIKSENSI
jgi:hypothetical protein